MEGECLECFEPLPEDMLLPDFRVLSHGDKCLCRRCSDNSASERIQELQQEIFSIVEQTLNYHITRCGE